MEILQGIVSKIGEYTVELAVKQGRYLIYFKSIVAELGEEEAHLKFAKERMEQKVVTSIQNNEIIEKDVEKWQTDTRNILAEVQRLKDEIEVKKSYLNGWCPNLGPRYRLGRKASKKTSIMLKLRAKEFATVSHPAPLPGIQFSAPKDFELFQSSKDAFNQITMALQNDCTSLVGLYGMGGSGKTTLAKKLGSEVEGGIFSKVVIVVVSQNPDFKAIQSKLAKSLGVNLEEEDDEETRAKQLYLRFTQTNTENKENSLVILDDVWKKFDLKSKIGFPHGDDNNYCKILLTTRRKQLCTDMGCQVQIQLELLNGDEGLTLLKRNAGIDDRTCTSELIDLATEIAKECKGLPLAIATIGSVLKGKSIDEWEVVLRKLKTSKLDDAFRALEADVGDDKDIYSCLKVSYDYLRDEKNKFCFLLCSLFPEDYEIRVDELIVYVKGLDLFSEGGTIKEARKQLCASLNSLKASSLLLDASQECVKMHDIVRHVALWIASEGNNVFMSKSSVGLMEWSNEKSWAQYTAISLWYNKIEELPVELVCPKLEILFLGGTYGNRLKVSDECFKEMKALKVLSLSYVAGLSLNSLEFSTNLKTLKLIDCTVRDISYLQKLTNLRFFTSKFIIWMNCQEN